MPLGEDEEDSNRLRFCGVETHFNKSMSQILDAHGNIEGGFDFVVVPLTSPTYRPSLVQQFESFSLKPWLPYAKSDLSPLPTPWHTHVIGKISEWIDLDSTDEILRKDSETAFKQEIARASYLSLDACILPTPKGNTWTNYARCANQILQEQQEHLKEMQLWLRIPLGKPDDDSTEIFRTPDDYWKIWNSFRLMCDHNSKLLVALDNLSALPSDNSLNNWYGEPIAAFIIHENSFFTRDGDNVKHLSEGLQKLVTYCLNHSTQPFKEKLKSASYQKQEEDRKKYKEFERAICQALLDRVPDEKASVITTVLVVVGAGRKALVKTSLQAAKETGRKLKVYAAEKNLNPLAYLYKKCNEKGWNDIVTLAESSSSAAAEHCNQCKSSFIDRAIKVKKEGLQNSDVNVVVKLKPEKGIRHSFKPLKKIDIKKILIGPAYYKDHALLKIGQGSQPPRLLVSYSHESMMTNGEQSSRSVAIIPAPTASATRISMEDDGFPYGTNTSLSFSLRGLGFAVGRDFYSFFNPITRDFATTHDEMVGEDEYTFVGVGYDGAEGHYKLLCLAHLGLGTGIRVFTIGVDEEWRSNAELAFTPEFILRLENIPNRGVNISVDSLSETRNNPIGRSTVVHFMMFQTEPYVEKIFAYDFQREQVKWILPPNGDEYPAGTPSLCALNNRLCCAYYFESNLCIYQKTIFEDNSWEQLLQVNTLPIYDGSHSFLPVSLHNHILLVAFRYDSNEDVDPILNEEVGILINVLAGTAHVIDSDHDIHWSRIKPFTQTMELIPH